MVAALPNTGAGNLAALLPASPDAYPQAVDLVRGQVLVIRMDARAYRAASFLDDRILGPGIQGAWLPGAAVTQAARQVAGAAKPLHFIFHSGHVGSTLLSRLLDDSGLVLGLREPLPFRTLADAHDVLASAESLLAESQFEALLDMLLRLWSRGYDWTRAVIVKATSSAGRIAPRVLQAAPAARAVYLSLRPEPYVATLLGGANSAADLRGHGPGRMRRLLAHGSLPLAPLHALAPGELAALGWLAESLSRAEAQKHAGRRLLAIDFDGFLADVAETVARVLGHFGLPRDAAWLTGLDSSPALHQYSKAPERPYPPGKRSAELERSRRENGGEIRRGLDWLERMGRADGRVATLLAAEAP
jgi:hypothetical protein